MLKAVVVCLLLLATPLAHADIAGQEDAAYVAARDIWLAGDDATALPALSDLAKSGNTAAQILLGRIEPRTNLHSHITGDMDRKARIALLRKAGGLSGKSWLATAAKTTPLAQAFLDAKRLETQAAAALVLLENGEAFSALQPAVNLTRQGELDAALAILEHPATPKDFAAAPLYWRSGFDGIKRLPEPPLTQTLLWRMSGSSALKEAPLTRIAVVAALMTMPQAAPARAYCATYCPDTINNCTTAVWAVRSWTNPFSMQTPAQTLITQAAYTNSPRYADDLRRLASSLPINSRHISSLDQCAADALGLN